MVCFVWWDLEVQGLRLASSVRPNRIVSFTWRWELCQLPKYSGFGFDVLNDGWSPEKQQYRVIVVLNICVKVTNVNVIHPWVLLIEHSSQINIKICRNCPRMLLIEYSSYISGNRSAYTVGAHYIDLCISHASASLYCYTQVPFGCTGKQIWYLWHEI
jgi:hypothetical protein